MSVPDIQAATQWYTDLFGFELIGGKITHIKRSDDPSAPIFAIYGSSLHEVKLAYMATGNGVGFELFEFINPAFKKNGVDFAYNNSGFFHICVTDWQPDHLAERVVTMGGARVGTSVKLKGGVTCIYVKDPWGNVVEILDTSFERMSTIATA